MDIQKLIDYSKKNITPVKGEFPEKPYGVNSLIGWLKQGYRPKDVENGGTIYKMYNKPDGYKYFSKSEVVPLTEEEKAQVATIYGNGQSVMGNKPVPQENNTRQNTIKSQIFRKYENLISVKVETTGFYPEEGDEILQISFANQTGVFFNCYLKPHNKTEWPKSEQVHHISPEKVKNAPYPEYVKAYVQEIVDKADGVVSYNADFNMAFLRQCMKIEIPDEKVIDAYEIFKAHKPYLSSHRLGDAIKTYVNNERAYQIYQQDEKSRRGGYDALCTLLVFKQMKNTITKENYARAQQKQQAIQEQEEDKDAGEERDDR